MPNNDFNLNYFDTIIHSAQNKLTSIIFALIVFFIGYFIIKALQKPLKKWLTKLKIDISFHAFILSLAKITLTVLLGMSCLEMSGLVKATSLVTALSAVGLAVSLAVKDSLSNLAGGMTVLFTKPFEVGDFIDVCGYSGTVTEIGIAHTMLKTVDNKIIYLPSSDVAKAQITNYSKEPTRRLDIKFSVGYQDDFEKAEKIILDTAEKSGLILHEPAEPFARVCAHSSSSIDIQFRVWVKSENYWDLHFYMYEQVKKAFDENGISIPFNQLDVHIDNNK